MKKHFVYVVFPTYDLIMQQEVKKNLKESTDSIRFSEGTMPDLFQPGCGK